MGVVYCGRDCKQNLNGQCQRERIHLKLVVPNDEMAKAIEEHKKIADARVIYLDCLYCEDYEKMESDVNGKEGKDSNIPTM